MLLRGRAALIDADETAAERLLDWLETRLEDLGPGLQIHADFCSLRGDITKQRSGKA